MAKKIYLSAAAHAADNPTRCPQTCGENTHCNQYMDIVERRLKELGFEVKRGDKRKTGGPELQRRVSEANKWGADIYYAAHTNAGGGRYSMTMCYPSESSRQKAEVFHKYRKCVDSHQVKTRTDLYEINATAMTCLYDELFFHDNAEDCAWFHKGGMEKLAEETVQALCEICGVAYKAPVAAPAENKTDSTEKVSAGFTVKEWQTAAIADGFKFPKYGADGKWGGECEAVAKKAIVKKRLLYINKNLTRLVQRAVGVTDDGLCGNNTAAAIKTWQKANGLAADGCVGINSWKKMLKI